MPELGAIAWIWDEMHGFEGRIACKLLLILGFYQPDIDLKNILRFGF